MQTRVALVGAHGVGKTTLLKSLEKSLEHEGLAARLMPEIPRMICDAVRDATFFRRGKNTLLKQTAIIVGQLVMEGQPPRSQGLLLCDRTVVDHWAYTRALFRSELQGLAEMAAFEDMLQRHCNCYNCVYYIPIEFGPHDDGTREADPAFQRDIDSEIIGLLNAWKVLFVTVTGSVEKRTTTVLEDLRRSGLVANAGL